MIIPSPYAHAIVVELQMKIQKMCKIDPLSDLVTLGTKVIIQLESHPIFGGECSTFQLPADSMHYTCDDLCHLVNSVYSWRYRIFSTFAQCLLHTID